jgi:hypothetical protein
MHCRQVRETMSYHLQPIPARSARGLDRKRAGAASQGSGRVFPFKPRRDHMAAIILLNPLPQRVGRGDQEKVSPRRLVVFKLPAYDPVAIAVMGFGIVFAVALALAF